MSRMLDISKRILLVLIVGLIFAVAAVGVKKAVITKAGSEEEITVKYYYVEERLIVKKGSVNYRYYTTDKVSSKVPAINKWKKVPEDGFSCRNINGAKIICFANSTTPMLDDIVKVKIPARPKITKFSYDVIKDEWTVKANVGIDGRCIINGALYGSNNEYEKEWLKNSVDRLQLTGGFAYIWLYPLDEKGDIAPMGTDDCLSLYREYESQYYEFPNKASRESDFKHLKIAKKANGPSVSIDYSNHYVKVPANVDVVVTNSMAEVADYTSGTKPKESKLGNSTVYFFNDEEIIYNFKTKATDKKIESLDTIVPIKETSNFEGEYKLVGTYEKDAYLEAGVSDGLLAGESITYQYAILNEETMNKVICSSSDGKYFNYEAAVGSNGKSIIQWKNIKCSADKKDPTKIKMATAKIVNSKTSKKDSTVKGCVLLRVAAKDAKPSSKVIVFTPPTKDKPYWVSTNLGTKEEKGQIAISDAELSATTINFTVYNGFGNCVPDSNVFVNKVPAEVTYEKGKTGNDLVVAVLVPANFYKDKINLDVTMNSKAFANLNYNYSYKIANADLKMPELVSNEATTKWKKDSSGINAIVTAKVSISENLATYDGKNFSLIDSGKDIKEYFQCETANYSLVSAEYKKATKSAKASITFILAYSLENASSTEGLITMRSDKKFFDLAGFEFTITDGGIKVKSDATMTKYAPKEE